MESRKRKRVQAGVPQVRRLLLLPPALVLGLLFSGPGGAAESSFLLPVAGAVARGGPVLSPRMAAMDDHLVEAVDGVGLRIAHVRELGQLPLAEGITAVAARDRTIYAATDRGGIAVLDASVPASPVPALWIPHAATVRAMAVAGSVLYALSDDGLVLLDLQSDPVRRLAHEPAIHGVALRVAGRQLEVFKADGEVAVYRNTMAALQVFSVNVNNNFFSPADLVLQEGDTVSWRNLSGFHNVLSCVNDQSGCDGAQADTSFTSGAVAGPPWLFRFLFTTAGLNPYVCVPHAPFMVGSVTVEAPPMAVQLDMLPEACPNVATIRSGGVLIAALAGSVDLDVNDVDTTTVKIAGLAPMVSRIEDLTSFAVAPGAGGICGEVCAGAGPDGVDDLILEFDAAALAAAAAGQGSGRSCVTMSLTGRLTPAAGNRVLTGADVVLIQGGGRSFTPRGEPRVPREPVER